MATLPKFLGNICWQGILIASISLHAPAIALTATAESARTTEPIEVQDTAAQPETPTHATRSSSQPTGNQRPPWAGDRTRLLHENKTVELVELLEAYAADPGVLSKPNWEAMISFHLGEAYRLAGRLEEAKTQLREANKLYWRYQAPTEILAVTSAAIAQIYRQTDSPLLADSYYTQAIRLANVRQSATAQQLAMDFTCELAEARLEWHNPQTAKPEIDLCISTSVRLFGNDSAEALRAKSLLPRLASEEKQEQERRQQEEPLKTIPNLIRRVEPIYPYATQQLMQEGEVVLLAVVQADGSLQTVEIQRSSGIAALDTAALEAVRQWEFEAARDDSGQAVESAIGIPFVFQLQFGRQKNPLKGLR